MSGAIWLASYPRSGNTWTRLALYSLHHDGAEIDFGAFAGFGQMASGRELVDRTLEVDSALLTADEMEEFRPDTHAALYGDESDEGPAELCKVHDAWIRTPSGRPVFDAAFTRAAIYLVRDPRDVAISWSRFSGLSIPRSVAFLCSATAFLGSPDGSIIPQLTQRLGSWSSHARSWIDESGLNPLVIRYEDMLADPAPALRLMAAHIGWPASDDAVARAVETTRFDNLAAKEKREGFRERPVTADRFFRSGKSGGWRDILTSEQIARIERENAEMMTRFGYL